MEHTIYTYGGGEYLVHIFNAIASVAKLEVLSNVLLAEGMIGIVWFSLMSYHTNSIQAGLKWGLWFLIATNMILKPTTSVVIEDLVTDQVRTHRLSKRVKNVPLLLASFASTVSCTAKLMTDLLEMVFSLPDAASYHRTGMVFASRLVGDMPNFVIADENFRRNMETFVNRCVVMDANIGYKYTHDELMRSNDIWKLVNTSPSEFLGFHYRPAGREGHHKFMTCKAGAAELNGLWKTQIDETAMRYGKQFFGTKSDRLAHLAIMDHIGEAFGFLTKASAHSAKLLQQQMMIDVLFNAPKNEYRRLGGFEYAANKSQRQQKNAGFISGETAARFLPALQSVFSGLCYASSIFVFAMIGFPFAHRIVLKYAETLIWVQFWPPFYSILNLFLGKWASNSSVGQVGKSGLTLMTSNGLANVNESIASTAGWLMMSVPVISYMVVKGGAAAFSHIAGSIASAQQAANTTAASELTSGNFSLENVTRGVHNLQNFSAFQHNGKLSHMAGQQEFNTLGGGITTVQGNGNLVGRSGAGLTKSQAATQIRMQQLNAASLNTSCEEARSIVSDDGKALNSSKQTTLNKGSDFLQRHQDGVASGKHYDHGEGTNNSKAISNAVRFSQQLQDRYGFDQKTANALALTAGGTFETPLQWLVGAGLNAGTDGTFTSSSGKEFTAADIKDFTKDQNYTENLDTISKAAENTNYNDNQLDEKSAANIFSTSLGHTNTLSRTKSVHEQELARLSEARTRFEQQGVTVETDVTQAFKKYVANSKPQGVAPINGLTGIVGHNKAQRIIDSTEGPLFQEKQDRLKDFKKQFFGETINEIKTKGIENMDLFQKKSDSKLDFDAAKSQFKKINLNNNNLVQADVLKAGLGKDFKVNDGAKLEAEKRIKQAKTDVAAQQKSINASGKGIQQKVEGTKSKNTLLAAAGSFGAPGLDALKGAIKGATPQGFVFDNNNKGGDEK